MSSASRLKLIAAVLGAVPSLGMAQSLSYVNFGGPGTAYTQDFNTLPFAISNLNDPNGSVGFSGTGGNAVLFQNFLNTQGPVYDLGSSDPNYANPGGVTNAQFGNILYQAFQAETTNSYPTATSGTTTVVATTVVSTGSSILTPAQANQAFQLAASSLHGWAVGQYLSGTATTTVGFRFLADNGGPSNTGSVRSFGLTANGLVQNGTVVATGQPFNPASVDTSSMLPFQNRSLGTLASGTSCNFITLTLLNNSNSNISSITVNTLLDVWRRGNTVDPDGFHVSYLISSTDPQANIGQQDTSAASGVWTTATSLNTPSPFTNSSTPGVTLNAASPSSGPWASVAYSRTLALQWAPGTYLTLRYLDLNNQGNDDGISLDNYTLTATGGTVAPGAHYITWTGATDSTFAAGGSKNFSSATSTGSTVSLALTTGDVVTLDNTGIAHPNITVAAAGVTVSQLLAANSAGTYTLMGGGITSTIGLAQTGAGSIVLNNGANDFGSFGIRATGGGTVGFYNSGQLGGSSAILVLDGGSTLQSLSTSAVDLSANTVTFTGVGGTVSNAGPVNLGGVAGVGNFVKAGAGALTVNSFSFNGYLSVGAGSLTLALPSGSQVDLTSTDGNTVNGDLVLASAIRLDLNTFSAGNGGSGGVLGGAGHVYVDASGCTISTASNSNDTYFTSIQAPIILNRNGLPNFVFNIFPGFAGASRLQVDTTISGPLGQPANASINFADGPANGNGSVVLNQPLSYTGGTTINVIGGTAGAGGPVILGVNNALPTTTTLGFNTSANFTTGSSGSGYLSLGNSVAGSGFSQTLAGLYSGSGNAPLSSFANVQTAFGGVANTVTGTDPLGTQLTLNIAAGATFTFTGQLLNLFSLIKTGPGLEQLGAVYYGDGSGGVPQTSNYTGTTEIRNGTIEVFGGDNRLSFNAPLILGDSANNTPGVLLVDGINQTVSALGSTGTSSGNLIVANAGNVNGAPTLTATLTVLSQDFNNGSIFEGGYAQFATTTYAGTLADGTAQLSVIKTAQVSVTNGPASDLGELHLTGSLAYSGNTAVTGGNLFIQSPLRPLAVNPATTLGSLTASGSSLLVLAVAPAATSVVAAQVNAISVTGGATLSLPLVDRSQFAANVVVTNQLAVDASSFIDLGTSDLIDHGGTSELPGLSTAISNWYAGGARDGLGLGSTALAQGASLASLTSLGAIVNSDGQGGALYSTFDGVSVSPTDVLVKYTYIGDTTLKGYVDADDLANTLAGLYGGLSGWENGDFFYTGTVTSADVTALLASLQGQGASFGNGTAGGPSGAVPEPSALAFVPVAGMALLRRRRA
jgi:hypothetical protein